MVPRHSGRSALLLIPLSLCLIRPAPSQADGCFLASDELATGGEPSSAAQKAILIREGGDEVLLLQTTYHGPASAFAWVVPVPSEPTDVFEAEEYFIKAVIQCTEPRTVTELDGDRSFLYEATDEDTDAEGDDAPSQIEAGVTVLSRRIVGDYDAAILSATGANSLKAWLGRNKYRLPDGAQAHLQPYVDKGWVFVAVRLLEGVAAGKPYVADVSPLGIRFPSRELVYPLGISRISAPPLSAILLCVIDDGPVRCKQLPVHRVMALHKLSRRQTYGGFRRHTSHGKGPALLCEYSASGFMPFTDLSYRADDWLAPRRHDLRERHATRFFGLLAEEQLADLVFEPDASVPRDYVIKVTRTGSVDTKALRSWRERPAKLLSTSRADAAPPGTAGNQWTSLLQAKPLATRGAGRGGSGVPHILLVVVASAGALCLFTRRRRGRPLSLILIVVVLCVSVRMAVGGYDLPPSYEVERILSLVNEAGAAFQQDTGCVPKRVEDLVATRAPKIGLDASGNEVPLTGEYRGPYLSHLPSDPLKGPGFVCDPLASRPIDSGGYRTTVAPSGVSQASEAADIWWTDEDDMQFWHPLQTGYAGRQRSVADQYAAWISSRRSSRLASAPAHRNMAYYDPRIGPQAFFGQSHPLIADLDTHEAWHFRNPSGGDPIVAVMPDLTLLVGALSVAGRRADLITDAHLVAPALLPRPGEAPELFSGRPLEGLIKTAVVRPDAKQMAVLVSGQAEENNIFLIDEHKKPRGPLASGIVFSMHYSPDSRYLYVLGSLGEEFAKLKRRRKRRKNDPEFAMRMDRFYPHYSLVRFPTSGGDPRRMMEEVDCGVMDVNERGVLLARAGREFGVLDHTGEWTKLGTIPTGHRIVGARLTGDAAVVGVASVPTGEKHKPAPYEFRKCAEGKFLRYPLTGGKATMIAPSPPAADVVILAADSRSVTYAMRWRGYVWTARTVSADGSRTYFTIWGRG